MSDHMRKLVEERRSIKKQSVQPEQENRNCLKRKGTTKIELKRSCRKDKDQIDEIANKLEAAAERRDVRKLYNVTRRLSGKKDFQKKKPLGDKDGKFIGKAEEQE